MKNIWEPDELTYKTLIDFLRSGEFEDDDTITLSLKDLKEALEEVIMM